MSIESRRLARWVATSRLARRELVRHRWRTLLLGLLVAVPLAGVTLGVVAVRSSTWTARDARTALLGRADDVVDADLPLPDGQGPGEVAKPDGGEEAAFRRAVRRAYPAGSRVVTYRSVPDGLQTADGHLRGVEVTDQPVGDALLDGVVDLVEGVGPARPGQAAATSAVLEAAGAQRGDEIELVSGRLRITGVLADPADGERLLLVVAGGLPSHPQGQLHAFVDAPVGFVRADRTELAAVGAWSAAPVGDAFDRFDGDLRYRLLVTGAAGGVILAPVVVLLAAGFAIAARQQLRTLGLLAASGIPSSGLRQIVLSQGILTGLVGSLAGVALGLVAARTQGGLVERMAGTTPNDLAVRPLDLLVVVLGGVMVPAVAAWVPARLAGRAPVVAALGGRRSQEALPARVPLAAAALTACGLVALAVWARHQQTSWGFGLAATLATLFGGLGLAPWLVSLADRLTARTRGAGRLAVRELTRHRLRSGAAVAALAGPAAFIVFAATLDRTDEVRRGHETYEHTLGTDEVLLVDLGAAPDGFATYHDRLRRALPAADLVTLDRLDRLDAPSGTPLLETGDVDRGGERRDLLAVRPDALARLGAPGSTVRALDRGAVVVFGQLPGVADVRLTGGGADAPAIPDVVVDRTTPMPRARGLAVVSPATASTWGLRRRPNAVLARAPAPLTEAQREAVDAVVTTRCDTPVAEACDDEDLRATLRGTSTDPVWLEIGLDHAETSDAASGSPLDVVRIGLIFLTTAAVLVLALTTLTLVPQRVLLHATGVSAAAWRRVLGYHTLLVLVGAMVIAIPGGLASAFAILSRPHATGVGPQVPWDVLGMLATVPLGGATAVWSAAALIDRRPGDTSTLSDDQR